ncbi:hypothetical protein OIU76_019419 [Salix suchowensis]|nr:hypothetical protein OIU76_019419 [Salix suchowensis]KAJ6314372.1 hypothetical protein OIU78_017945 [Salix suchowensis]
MKVKLKKILDRLKDLVEQKYVLGLGENIGEKPSLHKTPTTSLVDESGVFGRNNDKEAIVKLLLSDNAYDRIGEIIIGVIPIVGMCGVGKTTLGQLVYNDSDVQERFDLKTWVCVSDEFGVFKIARDILKEFGSKNCDTKTENQLHLELKEKFMGKKCLLVLDDVWDAEYNDFDILLTPLKLGAQGSDANGLKLAKKTRHLSYVRGKHGNLTEFEGTDETKFLRTFLLMEQSQELDHNENEAMHDLLPTLKRLRVLSLPQYSYVQELPDSIGNLKHLRYLNLFQASLKNLPRIIHALYNLQTLILRECKDLVKLPESIGNLKHLQHLDLFGTSIRTLPNCVIGLRNLETLILCQCKDLTVLPTNMGSLINLHHLDIRETNLKEMPLQMGNLKNLRVLTRFINTGSRIKELGELQHLRGTLEIWNLQNVVDALDALTANLKEKHIEDLQLRWHGDTDDAFHERDVLEQLQPHTNVEYISIIGYGGPTFPEWVGDRSFSNVVSLTLSECKRCSSLPPLGQLPSLKYLLVQAFYGVVVIGTEFYGSRMDPFRNLEELTFERMPHLQEWICSEGGAFPVLRELYIKQCPNMSKALPSHLPSLTTLVIEGCQQLAAALPTTPSICRLKLDDDSRDVLVTKLTSGLHGLRVDGFNPINSLLEGTERMGVPSTNLEDIEIRNCGSLVSFRLQMFSKLKSFQISECANLESLDAYERSPENFTRCCLNISVCPDLTLLRLWNCSNVRSLPRCMHSLLPSLESLHLVNCPELGSFPEGGLPAKLQSLQIRNCRKLIAGRMEWNLQALQCLSHFSFGEYEDIESFPEKTLLPTTLTTLGISDLQNLKSLDYEGLQHLTSLTQMRISHCPDLQSIPEEGLPSSLSSLIISQCPLLEQRCHNKGEDWSKISHIPDIVINWDS